MSVDSSSLGKHNSIMDGSLCAESDVDVAARLLLSQSFPTIGNICVLNANVHSHHPPSLQAAIRKAHLYAGGVILTDLGPESSITGDTFTPQELYIVPMSLMRPTTEKTKKSSNEEMPLPMWEDTKPDVGDIMPLIKSEDDNSTIILQNFQDSSEFLHKESPHSPSRVVSSHGGHVSKHFYGRRTVHPYKRHVLDRPDKHQSVDHQKHQYKVSY